MDVINRILEDTWNSNNYFWWALFRKAILFLLKEVEKNINNID